MSDDKIAEIRARHSRDDRWRNGASMLCPQSHDDRAFLLAEDARHRAEIERLRAEIARMKKLHTPPADIPWPAREEDKP